MDLTGGLEHVPDFSVGYTGRLAVCQRVADGVHDRDRTVILARAAGEAESRQLLELPARPAE